MRESKSRALPLGDTPVSFLDALPLGGKARDWDHLPIPCFLGWVKGLEPSTPGTTIRCSNQLSYTHHMTDVPIHLKPAGTPGGTRTPGPLLRRQLLYPPELQARFSSPPKSEPSLAGPIWKGAARNERAFAKQRKQGIWSLRRRWSG